MICVLQRAITLKRYFYQKTKIAQKPASIVRMMFCPKQKSCPCLATRSVCNAYSLVLPANVSNQTM